MINERFGTLNISLHLGIKLLLLCASLVGILDLGVERAQGLHWLNEVKGGRGRVRDLGHYLDCSPGGSFPAAWEWGWDGASPLHWLVWRLCCVGRRLGTRPLPGELSTWRYKQAQPQSWCWWIFVNSGQPLSDTRLLRLATFFPEAMWVLLTEHLMSNWTPSPTIH